MSSLVPWWIRYNMDAEYHPWKKKESLERIFVANATQRIGESDTVAKLPFEGTE